MRPKTIFFAALAASTFVFSTLPVRADEAPELTATLFPTQSSKVTGTVNFTEVAKGKVKVTAQVNGLKPNSKHGFHIHQYGDLTSPEGLATGGHFNPEKHDHALPVTEKRHAGDFGNLEANAEGVAKLELVVDNITLVNGKDAIIGRGLIVHAQPDDGGQPTGNAGGRIAQGVIGIKNPGDKK